MLVQAAVYVCAYGRHLQVVEGCIHVDVVAKGRHLPICVLAWQRSQPGIHAIHTLFFGKCATHVSVQRYRPGPC